MYPTFSNIELLLNVNFLDVKFSGKDQIHQLLPLLHSYYDLLFSTSPLLK